MADEKLMRPPPPVSSLNVRCPKCGAVPGKVCEGVSDPKSANDFEPHDERRAALADTLLQIERDRVAARKMSTLRPSERARSLGWDFQSSFALSVKGHGKALSVMVMRVPGEMLWALLALEAPAMGDVSAILNGHAHELLPSQPDILSAIHLAEGYALAWQRNPRTARAECGCSEISKASYEPVDAGET